MSIPDDSKSICARGMTYEGLWAVGQGWDYLTEENAERSTSLLCEYVACVVRLRNAMLGSL